MGLLLGSVVGTTLVHVSLLAGAPGLLGLDVTAFVEAARRLADSGSPYAVELSRGPIEHIPANVAIGYLYPPPIAQLFVPFRDVPHDILVVVWCGAQAIPLMLVLPFVYRHWGGRLDGRSIFVVFTTTLGFEPFRVAAYVGNVSGLIAVMTALMLVADRTIVSGSAALGSTLKVTPSAFVLAAIIDRTTRKPTIVCLLTVVVASVLLAPTAWRAFGAVLPSLIHMPIADDPANWSWSRALRPVIGPVADVVQLSIALTFAVASILLAWRGRRLGWVAAAAATYLSATATSWDHYFVVLLPVGLAAWPTSPKGLRGAMVAVWIVYGPLWGFSDTLWFPIVGSFLWVTAAGWLTRNAWRRNASYPVHLAEGVS